MSAERNAALTRRWFTEGWAGKMPDVAAIFATDLTTNGQVVGTAGPARNIASRLTGFPDLQSEVEDLVAVGDVVVTRVRWRGTHRGMYGGVPPTGKPVEVRTFAWWRFVGGKVAEIWTVQDQFGLLQQVGFLPAALWAAQVPATPPVQTATLPQPGSGGA